MALREVSDILWRERRLLEVLEFKLEEERLVAEAGHVRWLHRATREVALVRGELRRAELDRAVAVSAAAVDLGIDHAPTLQELADAAPTPWAGIFQRHRAALVRAADLVTELSVRCEAAAAP
ncbi:MAG: hypothetical protein QOE35_437 [Actinomycetota bacterium]|jgi:hypothetical protein